jgi:DNA-binding LacI/PurR family transcriptional regulator
MVGVVIIGSHSRVPFITGQLALLHAEFQKFMCDVSVHFVPEINDKTTASLLSWTKRLDAVVLIGAVPVPLAEVVVESGTPIILWGEPSDGPCPAGISNVTIDVKNMVHLAMAHLVSFGHRRILLCSCRGSYYADQVTKFFFSCAEEYGLGSGVADWYFDSWEEPADPERMQEILGWLSARSQPPTAILVEGAIRATQLIRLLGTNGWPIPERISVLAISASAHEPGAMEGLSMIVCSMKDGLVRVAEILPEMFRSRTRVVRVEKMATFCIPGMTCRRLEEKDVS